jgi:hypothetical protein
MTEPLKKLEIFAHPFGDQVDLSWQLPDSIPTNYQVYIFQRSKTDVTDAEITAYFTALNAGTLNNFTYAGLMVFDQLNNAVTSLGVYEVKNGLKYYYKALIRNEDTKECSTALSVNATPDCTIVTEIVDGKDLVCKALEKLFDTIKNKSGQSPIKYKDFEVVKNFAIDLINKDTIMVERINGSNHLQFWGNQLATYKGAIDKGEVDSDLIRVTILTIAGAQRRDLYANILRSRKQFLIQFLKGIGGTPLLNVSIVIEGDYQNPQFHGEHAMGITTLFGMLIENKTRISRDEMDHHITDMRVIS